MAQAAPELEEESNLVTIRKLFGGAFNITLPTRMIDLSTFRLIPDHQEVWTDASADQSVIIEILERVDTQDSNAVKYHFDEISNTNESIESKIMQNTEILTKNDLLIASKYHCSWIAGTQRVSKGRDTKDKSNLISLFVTCIRLKDHETDILITMNSPLIIHEKSQSAQAIDLDKITTPQTHFGLFKNIVKSFEIKDLTCIFGPNAA